MEAYFIRFARVVDEETGQPVLSSRGPRGRVIAVASGETFAAASASLKALVAESMAATAEGDASELEDPLSFLEFGSVPASVVVFSSKDLFPILLRYRRRAQGLTQEQVAGLVGVDLPAYAEFERGATPEPETRAALAMVLGVETIVPGTAAF